MGGAYRPLRVPKYNLPMNIHEKSVDMDMDMDRKFHIHGEAENRSDTTKFRIFEV